MAMPTQISDLRSVLSSYSCGRLTHLPDHMPDPLFKHQTMPALAPIAAQHLRLTQAQTLPMRRLPMWQWLERQERLGARAQTWQWEGRWAPCRLRMQDSELWRLTLPRSKV